MSRKHQSSHAPGEPGAPELWDPGSKTGVGTSVNNIPAWFTVGRGVVEEVYFPHADHPRTRFLGLAVADGADFFSWEQDATDSDVEPVEVGVPAYRLCNACQRGHYSVEKEVFAHPDRPAVVQRVRFRPAEPNLKLYTVLNPHLDKEACGWVSDWKGVPMLFASGDDAAAWRCASSSTPTTIRTGRVVGSGIGC